MERIFKGQAAKSSGLSRVAPINAYAFAIGLSAIGLVAFLGTQESLSADDRSPWPLLGFALLAILAEGQSVRLTENVEVSVAFLPLLFIAVVFGPLPAALIGAA